MKLIIFTTIVIGLFCGCSSDQKEIVTSISLANREYANDTLDVVTFDNLTMKESIFSRIILDSNGFGRVNIELDDAVFITIKMNKVLTILIFPNETIEINATDDHYSITGDQDFNNTLANAINVLNKLYTIEGLPFYESSEDKFFSSIAESRKIADSLRTVYFLKKNLNETKKELLESELNTIINNLILNYHLVNENNDTNYSELLISSPVLLKANSTSYYYHLQMFLDSKYVFPIWNQHKDDPEMRFNFFPRILNDSIQNGNSMPQIKEYLLAKSIFNDYSNGDFSDILDSVFYDYSTTYHNNALSQKIANYVSSNQQLKEGLIAPEIKASYINNEDFTMSDLNGKITVIDFWATWCGSCIHQFKYVDELKKKYESEVTFIYVSIDEDIAKWKNFVQSRDLSGIHLIATDAGLTKRNYLIGGVPRYVILDPSNRILKVNAPMPSSELFEDELKLLISKINKVANYRSIDDK